MKKFAALFLLALLPLFAQVRPGTANPYQGAPVTSTSIAAALGYAPLSPTGDGSGLTGITSTTLNGKKYVVTSIFDYMTAAQIADVQAHTNTTGDKHDAIVAALAAVGTQGMVWVPNGLYYTTPFNVSEGVTLAGEARGFDKTDYHAGTQFYNLSSTTPCITVNNGTSTGAILTNFSVHGRGSGTATPNASTDDGIMIKGAADTIIDAVQVIGCGGHGIKIDVGTNKPTIQNCIIFHCSGDGVHGIQTNSAGQILSVKITGNEIHNNYGHGINMWAQAVSIERNTIQSNSLAGIYLGYDDVGTTSVDSMGTWIFHNYLEENTSGQIVGLTQHNGGLSHIAHGVTIEDNWFYNARSITDVSLDCAQAWDGTPTYPGLRIRGNTLNSLANAWFDFHGKHDSTTWLELPDIHGVTWTMRFLGLTNSAGGAVSIGQTMERTSAGPELTSANYVGQLSRDTTNNGYSKAVSVGNGRSDWKPVTQTPYQMTQYYRLTDDFINGVAPPGWSSATVGTGTVASSTAGPNHPGVVTMSAAVTTANSGWNYYAGSSPAQIALTGGEQFDAVFNVAEVASIHGRIGFCSTLGSSISAAAPGTGIWLDLVDGTLTGKAVTNAGTVSATGTSLTLLAPVAYTASISGTTMTVSAIGTGPLAPGQTVAGTGIPLRTVIVSQLTGSAGSTGTYTVSVDCGTIASEAMTGTMWYHGMVSVALDGLTATYTVKNDLGTVLWTDTLTTNLPTNLVTTSYPVMAGVCFVQTVSGSAVAVASVDLLQVMFQRALQR